MGRQRLKDIQDGKRASCTAWSPAEDVFIIQSVSQMGTKWNHIANKLSEIGGVRRSSHATRNRWRRIQYVQSSDDKSHPINPHAYACRKCGLPRRGHTCTASFKTRAIVAPLGPQLVAAPSMSLPVPSNQPIVGTAKFCGSNT